MKPDVPPRISDTKKSDIFVNSIQQNNKTVVHYCVMKNYPVDKPNQRGMKPMNAKFKDGSSLLHYAAWNSHPQPFDNLINNTCDNDHSIESAKYTELMSELVAAGADINAVNKHGESVLSFAASRGGIRYSSRNLGFFKDLQIESFKISISAPGA